MIYRKLGGSELSISFIGLGTMNFGAVNAEKQCHEILDVYYKNGGNFIDTANIYSKGNKEGKFHERGFSEQIIGTWIKKNKREKIVLATKVKHDMGDGYSGLSEKAIKYQIDMSLKRLQTDYIDLYQIHGFDENVPLEETMNALNDLKNSGKIRYYGCCNLYKEQIENSFSIAQNKEMCGFVSYQNAYNLILKERLKKIPLKYVLTKEESELLKIGLITYNSLANGFLAGKFKKNCDNEPSSRGNDEVIRRNCFNEKGWRLLEILENLSKKYRSSIGRVVIDWYRKSDFITSILVGPRTVEQAKELFDENISIITPEEFDLIDRNSNFS